MPVAELNPSLALIAIDLQKGVATGPGEPHPAETVIANTARIAEAVRARGGIVVLVNVDFGPDGGDALASPTDAAPAGGERPEGWDEIVPELGGHPEDLRVTKHQWGAFHGTGLDSMLRRRGVTDVILTGISTNFGVESTARSAHEHGYAVILAEDAMTSRAEGGHEFAVTTIFPRLGRVDGTDAIVAAIGRLPG